MRRGAPLALLLCGAMAGCGQSARGADAAPPAATAPAAPAPAVSAPAGSAGPVLLGRAGGWRVTTYYTALESLYDGELKAVKGCARFHCSHGRTPLGKYPEDFLKVVQMEGSGRITEGPRRGRYLNWSHSVGFWLDDTTRDSAGRPLRPWESAAADRDVLARGRRFVITDCGRDGAGRPIAERVCARFRRAVWTVTDLFRPGYGGEHHADVYIGEETGPDFVRSAPWYTTLRDATIHPG